MQKLQSNKASALQGIAIPPGDKSISHRSLILATLAIGTTKIKGLLESDDVLAVADALNALGGNITLVQQDNERVWVVNGIGLGGFRAPTKPLDLGNSGTGVRLLMGAVAGGNITAVFTGDSSLSSRPMSRITEPLKAMGARIEARNDKYLPVTITAPDQPFALSWESPVASAQIKSAILLAGLTARGRTQVIEPKPSRNHTESMLKHFGINVEEEIRGDGSNAVSLVGEGTLSAQDITVPADPSSAAFLAVAALITPNSDITLQAVGINPLRFGLYETLIEMGGDISISNNNTVGGEMVADIRVKTSNLHGVTVPPERAATMIDEYPILSIAASTAKGETTMLGVEELRIKETDRIQLMADGLNDAGIKTATTADSLTVIGGDHIMGGNIVDACHDHRIAMAFLTLGLISDKPMEVKGCETIATSFPNFTTLMNQIGAKIEDIS